MPRQLPPAIPRFIGRKDALALLTAQLKRRDGFAGPHQAVVISVIGGTAGVGKTALAVRWAHQAAASFPDGQLYVNLRGFHPSGKPVSPAEAIRCMLDALLVPAERIPANPDAQVGLYRSLLSGKRVLVLLDNAQDADQVRPLLPGGPYCMVLITSRSQLAGLVAAEGANYLRLDLLSDAESRELLVWRLGKARLDAEPGAAAELADMCARLPLALAIAAARIAARPQLALAAFVDELRDTRGRLDALDTGDVAASVRAVFSWSVSSISDPAGRLFALLGLHPGPDITIPAAASLAGMPLSAARRALDELAGSHLLTEHATARFAMHDLLRAYAAELGGTYDVTERHRAVGRMLDYYVHTLDAANRVLYPARDPLTLQVPLAGAMPETLTEAQQAQSWMEAEHRVLTAVAAEAAELSFDRHAWQIPYYLALFLDLHGSWDEWAVAQAVALRSAQRLGDMAAQARIHLISSHLCMRQGAEADAEVHLRNALRLYRQLHDRVGQARIHLGFSLVLNHQGKHSDAYSQAQQSLLLNVAAGHRAGMAGALNAMGWSEAHLARPARAVTCCRMAIGLHRDAGNRLGEAEGLDSLGYAYHQLGDHRQAIECYELAIRCLRELACDHEEAVTRTRLGDVQFASGRIGRARDSWVRALAIFSAEHHSSAELVRRRLRHLGSEGGDGAGALFAPVN